MKKNADGNISRQTFLAFISIHPQINYSCIKKNAVCFKFIPRFQFHIWATSFENLFLPYANNKGTDQAAHMRSLISAFIVHCLDNIMPKLSKSEISSLASLCSWAGRFELYLVANPEDRFSHNGAHLFNNIINAVDKTVHSNKNTFWPWTANTGIR